eukprot:2088878-Amphidinium_carterae.1
MAVGRSRGMMATCNRPSCVMRGKRLPAAVRGDFQRYYERLVDQVYVRCVAHASTLRNEEEHKLLCEDYIAAKHH